jgi:hypothetical protein
MYLLTFGRLSVMATRKERALAVAFFDLERALSETIGSLAESIPSFVSFTAETVAVAAFSCCVRGAVRPLGGAWTGAGASLSARLLYCQSVVGLAHSLPRSCS